MKTRHPTRTKNINTNLRNLCGAPALFALLLSLSSSLFAQGTAFTYQGSLQDKAGLVNGSFDFEFTIYDAVSAGSVIAGPLTNSNVSVAGGVFTVALDFGSGVFDGSNRWLGISVRTNGSGTFTLLSPRQPITPAPYAIHAGSVNATDVSGLLPSSALGGSYANLIQFTDPGNVFVGGFNGDGSGLFNLNADAFGGLTTNDFWQTSGNAGTGNTNFLGTTDPQALELRVNNSRALRLEPNSTAPNVIGGHELNIAAPAVSGGAIGGGGTAGGPNQVNGSFGVVSGGRNNIAEADAAVGGGADNQAAASLSTVGGGSGNRATGTGAVVAGGQSNSATNGLATVSGGSLNIAAGGASVVAGGGGRDPITGFGLTNAASGDWSAIGGGRSNTAGGESATVGGGDSNVANGPQSTASGGIGNTSLGEAATIGGGGANQATGLAATVGGGQENGALGFHSTVGGGVGNYAQGPAATIGGGANNQAAGPYAGVPGGREADPKQLGQISHASGMFFTPGDAQSSSFVLRALTDIAQPTALMALDGAGTRLKIDTDRTFTFDILLTARAEPPSTDSAGYMFQGVVKNIGGAAALVGPVIATTLGQDEPSWSAALSIVGDELTIDVDGGANTGYAFAVRWVARVDSAEVSW